jgi:hypothetical protein
MRPLFLLAVVAVSGSLLACGGTTTSVDDGTGPAAGSTDAPKADDDTPNGGTTIGTDCPNPTSETVVSPGTIQRPTGSALRLDLDYQGSQIGVSYMRGSDNVLPGGSGAALAAGVNSGYWYETRSKTAVLYQALFQDPTTQEGFPQPGGGGDFSNSTIDRCRVKSFTVDVPNDPSATDLVIYGSPYGTNGTAVELARFSLE